jgi:hypothetical protein
MAETIPVAHVIDYGVRWVKMQLTFSCLSKNYSGIEKTLSEARLSRYMGGAGGDKHHALRLYVWNARLCEALYFPTQVGEVAVRNAIHDALRSKHGENWIDRGSFLCTLPDRLRTELDAVRQDERSVYGSDMNVNHLVSGLSFGFWVHLLTKNYDDVLWPKYFRSSFPNKPRTIDRQQLYNRVDRLRVFRNRIAHHKPIFDRSPTAEYQNILDLLSWVCADTRWFVVTTASVAQTISAKPVC